MSRKSWPEVRVKILSAPYEITGCALDTTECINGNVNLADQTCSLISSFAVRLHNKANVLNGLCSCTE